MPVISPAKEGGFAGRRGRCFTSEPCSTSHYDKGQLHPLTRKKKKKKSPPAPCISSTVDSAKPGPSPRTIAEIPTTSADSPTPALLYMQGTVATPVPACRPRRFRRAGTELGGLFLLLG